MGKWCKFWKYFHCWPFVGHYTILGVKILGFWDCEIIICSLFFRSESRSSEGGLLRLVEEAVASVQCSATRHRLRTYHACFQGSNLVDYLIHQNKANTRYLCIFGFLFSPGWLKERNVRESSWQYISLNLL